MLFGLDSSWQVLQVFIWLAVLLNEIFCTLYPQYYHLLSVGVDQNQYRSLMGQNGIPEKAFQTLLANIEEAPDAKTCFYILEDSREDMGLLRSLERNFQRIVNILQDYIEWSQRTRLLLHGPVLLRIGGPIDHRNVRVLNVQGWLMNVFLDGRLELSNNRAERAVRPFAVGRKNWLFSNTPKGADASAAIYSIVETAKANGLRPFPYLKLLLEHLPFGVPAQACLPWNDSVQSLCK